MAKTIYLTGKRGGTTLVDDEWYDYLMQWKWHQDNDGYAVRGVYKNGKNIKIRMHRVVNNTPKGFETDHINRNKLDNRACNLRTVTRAENALNCKLPSNNKSGYKGINWCKTRNKWCVYYKGKFVCCRFLLEDAVKARQQAEKGEWIKPLHPRNKSGYTGISQNNAGTKWQVQYKGKYYGTYSILKDAIEIRQKK